MNGKVLDATDEPMPQFERPDPNDPEFWSKMEARSKARMAHAEKMEKKCGPLRKRFMELLDKVIKRYGTVPNPRK